MINRRSALRIGGGALALTSVAGVVRAIDQGFIIPRDRPGLAAWDDWNQQRYAAELALVSAAVLASSPASSSEIPRLANHSIAGTPIQLALPSGPENESSNP